MSRLAQLQNQLEQQEAVINSLGDSLSKLVLAEDNAKNNKDSAEYKERQDATKGLLNDQIADYDFTSYTLPQLSKGKQLENVKRRANALSTQIREIEAELIPAAEVNSTSPHKEQRTKSPFAGFSATLHAYASKMFSSQNQRSKSLNDMLDEESLLSPDQDQSSKRHSGPAKLGGGK